jgi:hypothetical protein
MPYALANGVESAPPLRDDNVIVGRVAAPPRGGRDRAAGAAHAAQHAAAYRARRTARARTQWSATLVQERPDGVGGCKRGRVGVHGSDATETPPSPPLQPPRMEE